MILEYISVGLVVNAHGIKGDLRVQPIGQTPAFLTEFDTFYMDEKPVSPLVNRVHKSLILLKLPGIDTMDQALSMKGKVLSIRRSDAQLAQDEYFDEELVGLQVKNVDTGETLGTLTLIEPYPAHKLYTVKGERTYLIPAVKDVFIQSIDMENNVMQVHILEGMASDEN